MYVSVKDKPGEDVYSEPNKPLIDLSDSKVYDNTPGWCTIIVCNVAGSINSRKKEVSCLTMHSSNFYLQLYSI